MPTASCKSNILILNTCGFIQDAKEESIEAIYSAVMAKNEGFVDQVFVFGCLSQRYSHVLTKEIPQVDQFFGANDLSAVIQAVGSKEIPELLHERLVSTPRHYAYLKISEGCNRSCAFCAIPLIRGPYISTSLDRLVLEAQFLATQGVKELILVAQDTTCYGVDLYKQSMLAPLIERLTLIEGIEWIRLHYAYPVAFPTEVLELMAHHPKVCPYLDIPLQHISTKVLAAMRRGTDERRTRVLIDEIRKRVPGVVLRTTLMVGHPGEDKRAFAQLLSFVAETKFERLGAFTYSEEEETFAAQNYKDSVSKKIKEERYDMLMELQSGISFAYNQSRVGSQELVLIDRVENGLLVGRSRFESPEVDGVVYVQADQSDREKELRVGTFQRVIVEQAEVYDLYGKLIDTQ
jgi:ribosomal protein S12 methylthiotransferase